MVICLGAPYIFIYPGACEGSAFDAQATDTYTCQASRDCMTDHLPQFTYSRLFPIFLNIATSVKYGLRQEETVGWLWSVKLKDENVGLDHNFYQGITKQVLILYSKSSIALKELIFILSAYLSIMLAYFSMLIILQMTRSASRINSICEQSTPPTIITFITLDCIH